MACHGGEKQKARLRLDSHAVTLKGAESGAVVKAGDVKGSELFRRITLPRDDEDVMPSDGKPLLSADEIKIIELWIQAGASAEQRLADFPTAPAPKPARVATAPLTPDWRPQAKEIARLEQQLGLKLVPRSQLPTDGLILRTASSPRRCDDVALGKLAPVAHFIVEAEMARTKVTDAGLKHVKGWPNLRSLDLTATSVTSAGVGGLASLTHLEVINLTGTQVDDQGASQLKATPTVKRLWLFGSKASEPAAIAK